MAQSQNSSVYYTEKATSFHGMSTYGSVMLGNNAFEFYNERNPEDFIQIPWSEIDHVAASVLFGGKKISRFAIFVKGSESGFSFSTRERTSSRSPGPRSITWRRRCCSAAKRSRASRSS